MILDSLQYTPSGAAATYDSDGYSVQNIDVATFFSIYAEPAVGLEAKNESYFERKVLGSSADVDYYVMFDRSICGAGSLTQNKVELVNLDSSSQVSTVNFTLPLANCSGDIYVYIQVGTSLTTERQMVGSIVDISDTQTTQMMRIMTSTTVTVTGVGFYSTDASDYNISFTCDDDSSLGYFNPSTVTPPNTLKISSLSTLSCENVTAGSGLTATLVYQNFTSSGTNTVAEFMSIQILDSETTNVVLAKTLQKITIQGYGFFSSTRSDYTIAISGDGCTSSIITPSSVTASTSPGVPGNLVLSNFGGFSSCTDTIDASVTYGTYSSSATVASVVSVQETYLHQLINNDTTYVTILGLNFESETLSNYALTLSGGTDSTNCVDITISTASSLIDKSQLLFELSEGSIGNCLGTLLGTLQYSDTTNGAQFLSAVNVAFAISSLIDTSTTWSMVATSNSTVTIRGTNFLTDTISTYAACFDVYCQCASSSGSKVIGSNPVVGNDTLKFNCDISGCDQYVYGSFEYSNTTCGLGVLGSLSDETISASIVSLVDTSTTQSVFVDSNQTITISGMSLYETDTSKYSFDMYVISLSLSLFLFPTTSHKHTQSHRYCNEDVNVNVENAVLIVHSETTLVISQLNLSDCALSKDNTLNISLLYSNDSLERIAVATFVYISPNFSNQLVSSSTSLMVTGSGFIGDDLVMSFAASECDIKYDTITISSSSALIVSGLNLSSCYDEVVMSLQIASKSGSISALVGTIAMITSNDVIPQSISVSNSSVITVHGVGFVADQSLFEVNFLVTTTSSRRRMSTTIHSGTIISKSNNAIVAAANLENTTLDRVVQASMSIYLNGGTTAYVVKPQNVPIGSIGYVSVTDTSTSQGSIASNNMSVTLSGVGFYSNMLDPPYVGFYMTCNGIETYVYSEELEFNSEDKNDDKYIIVSNLNAYGCTGYVRVAQITVLSTNTMIENVSVSIFVSLDNSTSTYEASPTSGQILTVWGNGFGCSECYTGTLYLNDLPCETLESTSFSRVSSTELVISDANLTACTGGDVLKLELIYDGVTAASNPVAQMIHLNVAQIQILPAESNLSLTISGSGFRNPSIENSSLWIYSDTCIFEATIEIITSSSIVLSDVNLETCDGELSLKLNYNNHGLIDWHQFADVVELLDTYTSQVVQASSGVEILLVGEGFDSIPDTSEMTITSFEGTGQCDCDLKLPSSIEAVSDVSECDTIVNSTLYNCIGKLTSINLTGCGPCVLSATVSYESMSVGYFVAKVASVLGIYDTSTSQNVDQTYVSSLTIRGEGFLSSNISDYDITLTGNTCLNLTNNDVEFRRVSHESIVLDSRLNLTTGCDSVLSASLTYKNIKVSAVTIATVLSVTTSTYLIVVKENYNDLSITGMGFSGSPELYQFDFVCSTLSGDIISLDSSNSTYQIESNTVISVSNLYIDANCYSKISVTVTYNTNVATSNRTDIASVIGLSTMMEVQYGLYSSTTSQDVTIQGQHFDADQIENVTTFVFYTASDDDCTDGSDSTYYSNVTVLNSNTIIVASVDLYNCTGVVYVYYFFFALPSCFFFCPLVFFFCFCLSLFSPSLSKNSLSHHLKIS